MALWFLTAVKSDKRLENGMVKKVTEKFLVDALSFAEAEVRTTEERAPYMDGDFDVCVAKKTRIAEIFNLGADKYYLAKIAFITLDEKTAMEKKSITQILVGAETFKEAYDNLMGGMEGILADFEVVSIAESPILEVFPAKLAQPE